MMEEVSEKIRNLVNICNFYKKCNRDEWNALCVAMDTQEDAYCALKHYENFGLGEEINEKYLKYYGLLQAVFLHQDSIVELYNSLLRDDLKISPDSAWKKIRDLRNLTVGHPIQRGFGDKIERCSISQPHLQSNRIMLLVCKKNKSKDEFKEYNLKKLYETYKSEAIRYLNEIYQTLFEKYEPCLNEYEQGFVEYPRKTKSDREQH